MFAYCRNNPVCRIDITGYSDIDVEEISENGVDERPDEYGPAGGSNSGISGNGFTVSSNTIFISGGNNSNTKKVPTYPYNPYDFKPKGLEMHEYVKPGSGKNGGIIKWEIPGTKTAIFEWDEDYKVGSHYHAMRPEWDNVHNNDHIWPGSEIQEPWRSEYF